MYLIKQEKKRGRGRLKKPFIPLWVNYCWKKYSQIQHSWAANKKWSQSGAAPKCEFNGLNKCEEVCCWESVYTQKTLPGWKTYTTINNLHKHFKGKKKLEEWSQRKANRPRETGNLFPDTWRREMRWRSGLRFTECRRVWRNEARLNGSQALHNNIHHLQAFSALSHSAFQMMGLLFAISENVIWFCNLVFYIFYIIHVKSFFF